ncbi:MULTISPECIES: DUF4878 domain-containing protein [unclassified Clostridioides]|uniref:DUF4878 domain-containing protein n=1 Tax=unclassified Clostridioides TaxID=2635829 RepID=UPI001D0F8026|nr:DUF4878 domain-containing protein [Clostridioides sp. ZZV15-6388]MCC0643340.1 DUF4878 domain-containing protein [Clostridioides sp. ZZV14-6150]MCC0658831.1 DUF4878 domain-containing protein [Clostridioides sp. ZZV14-6154]MCC0667680.1 DUF4878 domain-containing protein [Clostridioides sp. ZZV14-6153]MCC0718576.1 DUF4878 domain-containing protein [Clostridioides sp. ZZV14-6105]MCC0721827.1 DUF4878 domain-containing protein [Clostridioides sp. ZZV14-6104]MCC0726786.1 DUF4878 domain-containing 
MKKIILLLTTFLLAISLTACSSAKPEDTINNFFSSAKKFDFEGMNKVMENNDEKYKDILKELETEDPSAQYVLDYLKNNASKITYTIKDSEIKNNNAKIQVECKFVDSTPLLKEIIAEAFTKMLGMSFSGQDLTDEKTTEMLVSIMKEKQKSVEETFVTKTVEFECTKKDNKWIISSANDALADVLLSNLVTAGEEFSNSMS